ncbi:MAG TPA: prolyl oligopeptidase family serine peptidase [Euzebyales bacterium]
MRTYPAAPTGDVVDEFHGTSVPDPYRWLEDTDAPQTRTWIAAQQQLTASWLAEADGREAIRARLTAVWDHPRRGAPWRRGARWFQLRNTGLQAQDVLWTMPTAGDAGEMLLDPNAWSDDGTAALTGLSVSLDGRWMAYARSDRGSDWMTWRVRDLERGDDHPDVVEWSKFSTAAWAPDGSGFYYSAYDRPAPGDDYVEVNTDQRLCFHRIGDDQDDDRVVYARDDRPQWGYTPWVSYDGRWLVVTVWEGTDPRTRLYIADLRDDGGSDAASSDASTGDARNAVGRPAAVDPGAARVRPLLDDFDAEYQCIGTSGDTLFVLTDRDAPNRRVVAIDARDHDPSRWREIVPAGDDAIEHAALIGGRLVVVRLHHASHRVAIVDLDGSSSLDVELGGHGAVTGLTGLPSDPVAHVAWSTFTAPTRVLSVDIGTARTAEVFAPTLPGRASPAAGPSDGDGDGRPAASDDLVTSQVFVDSDDGTRVPMFLIHRADVGPRHGPAPTILYGYGGFGISLTPAFSVTRMVWVERGGVLAVANLRGGGEYGTSWHDAGRLANKQQVFDDAIACAHWLADNGWTTRGRLAIEGGSNGGLLVGACITQRPDLFGAAVAHVGVFDMLRFHRFTIGWAWRSDYGDPDDAEQFATLYAYSPLHRVRPGTRYPATLIVTGDHDDRVVPGHSFKFCAALQAAQAADAPVLLRVETSAGHGAGKPTSKLIDEAADVLAFCDTVLEAAGDTDR